MDSSLSEKLLRHLLARNRAELLDVLANPDCSQNFSIIVNFMRLFEEDIKIGNGLLMEPEKYLSALNDAAISAQKYLLKEYRDEKGEEGYKIKSKVFVRIEGLPVFGEAAFPCNNDVGFFVKINGTLIKAGPPKLLEHQKDYVCSKCHHSTTLKAVFEKYYIITAPSKCEKCYGHNLKPNKEVDVINFIDYQEVKVQEHFGKSKVGTVPRTISVVLEGDLVDSCKPGDDVIVTGVLLRRWKSLKPGTRFDIDLVLKANNLKVCNEEKSSVSNKEVKENFSEFWNYYKHQELSGRNHIIKSFCPQIFGLHLAKLAMVTVLAGGVQKTDENGCSARGMSHLLLVGDAGTGKSYLLRYASRIFGRSVFTTGACSTSAGLTVAAVRENGDWNLEAGALVLADGGLCCIDDFNSIREHDRTSIHEAMEQQSISVAKAGIVTKLHTRCSIFATTSTKGKYDSSVPMTVNVAISSPLLSRFDIVLILLDSKNLDWDKSLCAFVFEGRKNFNNASEKSFSNKSELLANCIWSTSDIQSYFSVVKEINPVMTEEAGVVLRTYYQFQRMTHSSNAARTTVRLLESLIRLSQGHARLMFREKVTVLDAVVAIVLIESSMLNSTLVSEVNALHTVIQDNPYDEYKSQLKLILTRLKLDAILEEELRNIEKDEKVVLTGKKTLGKIINETGNSKFEEIEKSWLKNGSNGSSDARQKFNSTISEEKIASFSGSKSEFSESVTEVEDTLDRSSITYSPKEEFDGSELELPFCAPAGKKPRLSKDSPPNENEGLTNSSKRMKLSEEESDFGVANGSIKAFGPKEKKLTSSKAVEGEEESFRMGHDRNSNRGEKAKSDEGNPSLLIAKEECQKPHKSQNIFGLDEDDWNYLDL